MDLAVLGAPSMVLFCSCSSNAATLTRNTRVSLASIYLCRKSSASEPFALPFNISFLLQEEQSVPGLDYWIWQCF